MAHKFMDRLKRSKAFKLPLGHASCQPQAADAFTHQSITWLLHCFLSHGRR